MLAPSGCVRAADRLHRSSGTGALLKPPPEEEVCRTCRRCRSRQAKVVGLRLRRRSKPPPQAATFGPGRHARPSGSLRQRAARRCRWCVRPDDRFFGALPSGRFAPPRPVVSAASISAARASRRTASCCGCSCRSVTYLFGKIISRQIYARIGKRQWAFPKKREDSSCGNCLLVYRVSGRFPGLGGSVHVPVLVLRAVG